MSPLDPIVAIRAEARRLPLPRPLAIGPMEVRDRHYTVVAVTCESGTTGVAFGQTRAAPVVDIVDSLLAPPLLGRDGGDIEECWRSMYRSTAAVGRVGLVLRAISLVDIALWDAAGKRAGKPVFALLGGAGDAVRSSFVAGYPRDSGELDSVFRSALAAAARGHRLVKVARTPDPSLTLEMLEALDRELPPEAEIAVDANWVWEGVDEALAEVERWPHRRLRWIEDPFMPEWVDQLAEFRSRSPVPVAVGDEVADPGLAKRLIEVGATDVLRLDVSTIGGISRSVPLLRQAERAAIPVSFHINPETSIHLASAFAVCRDIETFDRAGNPFDPSHEIVSGGPEFAEGFAKPSPEPGLGFELGPSSA